MQHETDGAMPIRHLVDMIPRITEDLIVIVDEGWHAVWQNPALRRRIAAQNDVEPDQFLDWILSQIEDKVDFAQGSRRQGVEESSRVDRVLQLTDATGRQEWYQVDIARARHRGGPAHILTLHDVTDIKHRERNLVEANSMIEHRLNHDPGTGLPNRRAMLARVHCALNRQDEPGLVSILVVEPLQLRELTDIHGPTAAEEVVQELAVRLMEVFPPEQVVARTAEHELAVLLCAAAEAAEARARTLLGELRVDVPLAFGTFTAAVRIAVVTAQHQDDGERLLMNARIALHHREAAGASDLRCYRPEMRSLLETRASVYAELNEALDKSELIPFFQPQIRLDDRRVIGFEVLARWRHPERGLVPPGVFLGIAEDTGLLPRIDAMIVSKAFAALADWIGLGHTDLRVSINVSGLELRSGDYVERLCTELSRHGLTPAHVSLEILESVAIEGEDDPALEAMRRLHEAGFHLELDDFGTGYASIAMLVKTNIDTVKLDRSLVAGIEENDDNRTVVTTVLALARGLGLGSLAEGVEHESELTFLAGLGCTYAQGYGIARPMAFDRATTWLAAYRADETTAHDPAA